MIAIREYKPDDYCALVKVVNSVCAEGRWMHTLYFEPTEEWLQVLKETDSGHRLLIVTDEEKLIGWCRVFIQGQNGDLGIGILKNYRNQGIGTQLLSNTLKWAKNHELIVKLCCRPDNSRALYLFEKMGFVKSNVKNQMFTMVFSSGEFAYA